ncbi:carbohydrate ABC transporter permease [Globicatella sulfidifaciens]|uniref:carbohydrate ABC transporter permease n=1 Tax=Globicatella sulfidifaciens TaxID=136093 RepID=UPI00288E485B|nr:carbohydrate ABC transporter permease [Globicatella sulfidifaciens]MDT2768545.1 carbohydrate ABC transporter permease [Globicatella sulfidifaciens]
MKKKIMKNINKAIRYSVLVFVSLIMLYPILWMVGASFKTNSEIFTEIGLIPSRLDFSPYIEGWKTRTEYTFTTYFINTFKIVIPKLVFSLVSSIVTAYGFARFNFPFKKVLFSLMMATLFLPQIVLRIPLYLFWRDLGMLNTYIPLIANTVFAQEPFFVFMLIQFFRSIPTTLDEAATIDGCNSFTILTKVLLPSLKPAIVSCVIFQFVWSFNDYLGPLIYITSVEKYPVSMALKMNIDASSGVVEWNQIMAMSIISLLPAILLYFSSQKYFVEGVTSSGIKG